MKIKIKREGGFMGITSKTDLEFDKLTADEQNAFTSLAQKTLHPAPDVPITTNQERGALTPPANGSGLELAMPAQPRNAPNNQMRDGFNYSVSMRKDGKTVSMKFDDQTAPPEIVEIFQKYVEY